MQKQIYKKGNILFWIGFLGGILFNALKIFSAPELVPSLQPFNPLFSILALISLVVLVYGLILVLKSKNRSWAWIILLLPLNAIGAIIIYILKDKSTQITQSSVIPPQV